MKSYRNRATGFTLVELVMVIVVLSILALGTTRYIVTSSQSFVVSAERAKLIATARVAVEQVTRRMRNVLPNSVRISSTGNCIEFFPILVGSATTKPLLPAMTSLKAAPFDLSQGGTNYAVIAAFSTAELYDATLPSTGVIVATTLTTGNDKSEIPLAQAHTFTRSSPTQRIYVVSNPERFCVTGGLLSHYSGYGIEAISDAVPTGANNSLMAGNLDTSSSFFVHNAGSLTSNELVQINLAVSKGGESVTLNHNVQIRNVP